MSKESLDILAVRLTVALYVLLAILIITFTAVASGGIAGIPCLFGVPLVVWLIGDVVTMPVFRAPSLLGLSLYGVVTGLLTLGNWIYDKLSINPKKMVEVIDENKNIVENKNLNVSTDCAPNINDSYFKTNLKFFNTNSNTQKTSSQYDTNFRDTKNFQIKL